MLGFSSNPVPAPAGMDQGGTSSVPEWGRHSLSYWENSICRGGFLVWEEIAAHGGRADWG